MTVTADAGMTTADAIAKETTAGAAAIREATVETAAQTTMDATAEQISVRNPGLSRGPLCSTRTQGVDVRNLKAIAATVNSTAIF